MGSESTTYVYCVLRAAERPDLSGAPAGLARSGPPRLLELGDGLWLLVADAPLGAYSEEALERGLRDLEWVGQRAVEHEALVEHALALGTVVPMKLFTLFRDDERARGEVAARAGELAALLDRLEGRDEWGLRVLVDPGRAAEAVRQEANEESAEAESAGHAFLLRKRRVLEASRGLRAELGALAEEVHDGLRSLAADARRRPPAVGEGRLLLDASYLVPVDGADAFQAAVRERAAELAPRGLELSLTGPWPAYNFVETAP